ncbi:hypothetical protein ACQKM9_17215 [Viridibacillus sp. NPDC093762]|uniref:hypothetical protein n=1 Tax=Viridibacillus sp. NPDC093762 TaxID=3390720 RepID=UPI003CFC3D80
MNLENAICMVNKYMKVRRIYSSKENISVYKGLIGGVDIEHFDSVPIGTLQIELDISFYHFENFGYESMYTYTNNEDIFNYLELLIDKLVAVFLEMDTEDLDEIDFELHKLIESGFFATDDFFMKSKK